MRSVIRTITSWLVLCIAISTASSALAAKPIDYVRGPMGFGPFPFWDCTQFEGMDFWVWIEGYQMEEGKIFLNKDGSYKQTVGTTYTGDLSIWVPEDPGCNESPFAACSDPFTPAAGKLILLDDLQGKPEHSTTIWRDWIYIDDPDGDPNTDDGYWWPTWGRYSGINLRMVIPGYGAIFQKAGTTVTQMNPVTWGWEVVSVTPNFDLNVEDVFAACSYLNQR